MVKQITTLIVCALIGGLVGGVVLDTTPAGEIFGGVTNISGLSVGSDGLAVSGSTTFSGNTTLATTTAESFVQGGGAVATSTLTTAFGLLDNEYLGSNSVITLTPNVSSATTTLAVATSTLPSIGDMRTWLFRNGTSSAAISVGISAGTGVNLTSTALGNVQIQPDGTAVVTCAKVEAGIVNCHVDVQAEAD